MWARLAPPPAALDVATLGENSLDFVAVLAPAALVAAKRPLARFDLMPGGQMATAALACARLGLKARYIGAFGADEWGARARLPLDEAGVDVVVVSHPGCASRIAVVLVDDQGERTVLERRDESLRIDPIPAGAIEDVRLLLVDATDTAAALAAADRARAAGVPVLLDVDRPGPDIGALLAAVDVVIAPQPFVAAWTGCPDPADGLAALVRHALRASAVIVTMGEAGSLAAADGRQIVTPGFQVPVVDTTGAGDTFRAGFAAAWLTLGAEASIDDILTRANATAALACRLVGAQGALPTAREVDALVTGSGR